MDAMDDTTSDMMDGFEFDPDVLRQLRDELPDLIGQDAGGDVEEEFGKLVEQAAGGSTLQVDRALRALIMKHDPLHQRWLDLNVEAGVMTAKYPYSLFGQPEPPASVRYRCTAHAAHEFDEDQIERDALNRPTCPICGGRLEPFKGEG
jgi:hypothetical protein